MCEKDVNFHQQKEPVTLQRKYRYFKATLRAKIELFRTTGLSDCLRILRLSKRPIVIGGCARSGTTLMLSVLSCHPHIYAIDQETRALCPGGYRKNPMLLVPFKLEKIYHHLANHEIPDTCTRWCEKTPKNVYYLGRILDHFGKRVRIIVMVRDGRDVVMSTHPTDSSRYWVEPERWIEDVAIGRGFEDHPQVMTIRYEDLINKYEATLRRTCDFIDEDFVDAFYSYPNSAKVRQNAAWFREAQVIHSNSIDRWEQQENREVVDELMSSPLAIELLERYGYTI